MQLGVYRDGMALYVASGLFRLGLLYAAFWCFTSSSIALGSVLKISSVNGLAD